VTPRPRAKTRAATPADAKNYLQKSKEFLRAASDSLELGNCTAATGNAVHAGISAGDAISAVLIGAVSQGEHADAVGHLENIGGDAKSAARQLRQLLPLKAQAEYDPSPLTVAVARRAVTAAERIVAIADRVVPKTAGPTGG
jgi:HEPN domain-containing protein